jgi:hypothetical protein
VRAVWSAERAEALARDLGLVGRRVGLGFVITVFVVAYLDYVYRGGRHDKAARDAWAKRQRDLLRYMIKESGQDLAAYARTLRNDLAGQPPSADEVRRRNDELATKLAIVVVRAANEAPLATELMRDLATELGIDRWDELMNKGALELLCVGLDMFLANQPDLPAQEARALGAALGELIGTLLLERKMLPKKWHKPTGYRPIDRAVRDTLKGGTLSALREFARFPLEELRKGIATVAKDLPSLPSNNADVFERVQRKETLYGDSIRQLREEERRLSASLVHLVADATLPDRIAEVVQRAQSGEYPPDVDALRAGEDPLWPRDVIVFVLSVWLHVATVEMLRVFEVLEDSTPYDGHFRLATLLEIAGLQVSLDDKTVEELRTTFEWKRSGAA